MVGWAMVKEVLGETNSLPGHRCTLGTTPRCPLFLASLHGITAPCFKTQERQRGKKHIRTMYIPRRPRWFLRQHPAERSRGVPQRHRSGRPGLQSGFPGCQDYCSLNLCLFPQPVLVQRQGISPSRKRCICQERRLGPPLPLVRSLQGGKSGSQPRRLPGPPPRAEVD